MFMRARSRRRLSEMWRGYRSAISQAQPRVDDKVKACALIAPNERSSRIPCPGQARESLDVAELLPVTPFSRDDNVFHPNNAWDHASEATEAVARRSSLPQPTRPPRMAMTTDLTTT